MRSYSKNETIAPEHGPTITNTNTNTNMSSNTQYYPPIQPSISVGTAGSSNSGNAVRNRRRSSTRSSSSAAHRRQSMNNNNNNNSNKRKRKRSRWKQTIWNLRKPQQMSLAQESVFLTMHQRKLKRSLKGRKRQKGQFVEAAVVFILLVVIFGIRAQASLNDQKERVITLSTGELTVVGIWFLCAFVITSVFHDSPFIPLLYWMCVYLPLIAIVVRFVFSPDNGDGDPYHDYIEDDTSYFSFDDIVIISLIATEIFVFTIFTLVYYVYPFILVTHWFKHCFGRGRFWMIRVVADWTMTYFGWSGYRLKRYTCKYEGETDPNTGLPHGSGRWLDDSYEGEVLTGVWKQGVPVAPFFSRHYGTGDAFSAVRVAYVQATDDEFGFNKCFSTYHKRSARCGVASVECSVSGNFYNDLPKATPLEGPYLLDGDDRLVDDEGGYRNCIGELLSHMTHLGEEEDQAAIVQIKATDPRGVQVLGHVFEPTGQFHSDDVDHILVSVNRIRRKQAPKKTFMPRPLQTSFRIVENVIYRDHESNDSDDDDDDESDIEADLEALRSLPLLASIAEGEDQQEQSSNAALGLDNSDASEKSLTVEDISASHIQASTPNNSTIKATNGGAPDTVALEQSGQGLDQDLEDSNKRERTSLRMDYARLKVQDWVATKHRDALIFIPGFNTCLKDSLQNFGQFMAMTKMSAHVYPICFSWPGGLLPSYYTASRSAAADTCHQNLLKLVQALQDIGIRHVHFMSHSMGVQLFLGAFMDKLNAGENESIRSELSQCFELDPDFDEDFDEEEVVDPEMEENETDSDDPNQLLICKSITLLNPDFPLEAFVDRSFITLRRICSTITLIGDRQDTPLFFSSFFNGINVYFGYQQPLTIRPKVPEELSDDSTGRFQGKCHGVRACKCPRLQDVIGRSIESLHFPDDEMNKDKDDNNSDDNDRLLFTERAPVVLSPDDHVHDHLWLDMDVIDTTGLDTNIAGIRHNAFSLNPILLKDIEELITTGNRAMKRSTLLYRDGNIFSYSHAPSFVAM